MFVGILVSDWKAEALCACVSVFISLICFIVVILIAFYFCGLRVESMDLNVNILIRVWLPHYVLNLYPLICGG